MLRTFLVLLVAAVMSLSTVGCGGKEKPAQQEQPAGQTVTPSEGSETQPAEEMKEEAGSAEKGAEHPTPMTQPEGEGSGTNN